MTPTQRQRDVVAHSQQLPEADAAALPRDAQFLHPAAKRRAINVFGGALSSSPPPQKYPPPPPTSAWRGAPTPRYGWPPSPRPPRRPAPPTPAPTPGTRRSCRHENRGGSTCVSGTKSGSRRLPTPPKKNYLRWVASKSGCTGSGIPPSLARRRSSSRYAPRTNFTPKHTPRRRAASASPASRRFPSYGRATAGFRPPRRRGAAPQVCPISTCRYAW